VAEVKTSEERWLEYSETLIFTNNYQRDRQRAAFLVGYGYGVLDTTVDVLDAIGDKGLRPAPVTDKV